MWNLILKINIKWSTHSRNGNFLRNVAFETLHITVADAHFLAQVDRPADRRAELKVETLGDTAVELQAKKPLDTLGNR